MSEPEVITEEPDVSPVETPVTGLPAGDSWSEVQGLLDEFDQKTATPEPIDSDKVPPVQDGNSADVGDDEIGRLLADLNTATADQERANALQGQVNELRAQMRREQDWREFTEYAGALQQQAAELSSHIDENFVRLRLESAAHNPEIALAWDTRHINPADANRDLAYVQHSLRQLQADPNADPKQVQELNKLAYQLNVAANSPSILRRLKNTIMAEAKNLKPPIDELATADHDAVAFAVREMRSGDIPTPPVRLGELTDAEYRNYLKKEYNISGF